MSPDTTPIDNPFANPYRTAPEPDAHPDTGGAAATDPWQIAPRPYFSPTGRTGGSARGRSSRPQTVSGLVVIHAILAGFCAIPAVGLAVEIGSNPDALGGSLVSIFGLVINALIAGWLYYRPSYTVRILATVWSGLWSLFLLPLLITVPIFILLWARSTSDYLDWVAATDAR